MAWEAEIRTVEEANELAEACGWCPLPEHPEPRFKCESLERTRGCAETDYDAAYEQWETERDAWVAEDPENRDPIDYPVDPPDEPADYDDFTYGCYATFTAPGGVSDTDDVPTLYRKLEETLGDLRWSGNYQSYRTNQVEVPPYVEGSGTYALNPLVDSENNVETLTTWSGTGGTSEDFTAYENVCAKLIAGTGPSIIIVDGLSGETGGVPFAWPSTAEGWTDETEENDFTCTATTQEEVTQRLTRDEGTSQALQGVMPAGGYGTHDAEFFDEVVFEQIDRKEISGGFSRAGLAAEAIGDLPASWPTVAEGTDCTALLSVTWPTVGDLKVSDGEGGTIWPGCADGPPETTAAAVARKVRYWVGIPDGYSRTSYQVQWDEVFFPAAWDEWDQGGRIGTEPSPGPSLVASRSWTWPGSGEWIATPYELAAPTTEGETRRVNVMALSYNSKYGTKPSAFGETIDLGP